MTITTFGLIFVAMLVLCLVCHWLDHKYQLRLSDWLNGTCPSPFAPEKNSKHNTEHIEGLKQRIETLEAIVTEPGYELNQKINRL